MIKVAYLSGTRADYGLFRKPLLEMKKDQNIEPVVIATGMHLMENHGMTVNEIIQDGIRTITAEARFSEDDKSSACTFISDLFQRATEIIKQEKPDFIAVLGDRAEMMVGATIGAYMSIPVFHLRGGEISSTVDEPIRHAIAKLSPIHMPATEGSKQRLIQMGEEPWRITVVGDPGLDNVFEREPIAKKYLYKKLGLDIDRKTILVIQHPVTTEADESEKQMRETLEAVVETEMQAIIIYPNADAGGKKMIAVIDEYQSNKNLRIFKNIPHEEYLSLQSYVDVMVGNSSGGITEAPSFKLPVVNVGTRQLGRERATNIVDAGYNQREIYDAIMACLNPEFRNQIGENPYWNGSASKKIIETLKSLTIDKKLLEKRMTY